MKNFLIILFVIFSSVSSAQISKKDLLGTWHVKNISTNLKRLDEEQKAKLETVKKMFLKTTFVFKNTTVDFNFPSQEMAVKNGIWNIEMQNVVSVQKGKENIMKFFVENKKGKTFFVLTNFEVPYLILEVEK